MRARLLGPLFVTLSCVLLGVTVAEAGKEPEVGAALSVRALPLAQQAVDCTVGNEEEAVFRVDAFLFPPENYALIFDPATQCPSDSFRIKEISMVLETDEPCDVVVNAHLWDTVETTTGCFQPANMLCSGASTELIRLPSEGAWLVQITLTCPELQPTDQIYALGMEYQSQSCVSGGDPPAIITDQTPGTCINWNNTGQGWFDIKEQFPVWPGDMLMGGVVDADPVPVEPQSWGAVKGLFRD